MSLSSDSSYEMSETRLDESTIDRLLSGVLAPDDAPPGMARVAVLVGALGAPLTQEESAKEAGAVAAAVSLMGVPPSPLSASPSPSSASGNRKAHSRFFRTKVTSLVVVGTLLGTAGLAAAQVLPAPVQDAASAVLSKIGISVPDSTGSTHPASTGEEISNIAKTTDSTGVDKGAEISTIASGGQSQAGQHGKPSGAYGRPGTTGRQTAPGQATRPDQTSAQGQPSGDPQAKGTGGSGSGKAAG